MKSDLVGIISSALCLIHCLALPVLITTGIFSGAVLFDTYHWLDYLFISVAFLAVSVSAKKAQKRWIKMGMWGLLLIFSVSILLHSTHSAFLYISVLASFGLIFFHFSNYKYIVHKKSGH